MNNRIAIYLVAPKWPPGFSFFSIVLGAEDSFDVKSIATYTSTFLWYNNSVLAIVSSINEVKSQDLSAFLTSITLAWKAVQVW